jgi:uncharacterized protein
MEIIGYVAAIFIGISLGLIGGGGSILAFPILVYLFKIDAEQATTYSLFIVGFTALIGSLKHYRIGNLKIKSGIIFAIPSVVSLLVMRKMILPKIPSQLLHIGSFHLTKHILIIIVFAILMIAASFSMIKKINLEKEIQKINYTRLAFIGFLVGLVVGFVGAGGGFLIIPALIFFAGLQMKEAVGTSLLIIFINSSIGFVGDFIHTDTINLKFLISITLIAVVGMFIGTALSKKIDSAKLKPAFGWFILVLGVYIIINELFINSM